MTDLWNKSGNNSVPYKTISWDYCNYVMSECKILFLPPTKPQWEPQVTVSPHTPNLHRVEACL